nr:unnamed protein product [Callosobruchus chinensis]
MEHAQTQTHLHSYRKRPRQRRSRRREVRVPPSTVGTTAFEACESYVREKNVCSITLRRSILCSDAVEKVNKKSGYSVQGGKYFDTSTATPLGVMIFDENDGVVRLHQAPSGAPVLEILQLVAPLESFAQFATVSKFQYVTEAEYLPRAVDQQHAFAALDLLPSADVQSRSVQDVVEPQGEHVF